MAKINGLKKMLIMSKVKRVVNDLYSKADERGEIEPEVAERIIEDALSLDRGSFLINDPFKSVESVMNKLGVKKTDRDMISDVADLLSTELTPLIRDVENSQTKRSYGSLT